LRQDEFYNRTDFLRQQFKSFFSFLL